MLNREKELISECSRVFYSVSADVWKHLAVLGCLSHAALKSIFFLVHFVAVMWWDLQEEQMQKLATDCLLFVSVCTP